MSQRERYIVIGTAAVVGLFALDRVVLTPLMESRTELKQKIEAANQEIAENDLLFQRRDIANRKWAEMTAGALKRDPSVTESQLINSIGQWQQEANMRVSYKPERTEKQKDFVKVTYRVEGKGSMRQLRTLLLSIQHAPIPIRISDLAVNSRPEGTDNLEISMGLATVYLAEPEKPRQAAAATYREAY